MKHPHAEVIHAWADGAQIQVKQNRQAEWMDITDPCFCAEYEYRVKPQPKPWYENIPEYGVLCKVWDDDGASETCICPVVARGEDNRFITDDNLSWLHAEPLTNDEIKRFLRPEEK